MNGKRITYCDWDPELYIQKLHLGIITDQSNFRIYDLNVVIEDILDGKYKLYEEKPKFIWSESELYWNTTCIDDKKNYYHIKKYINTNILMLCSFDKDLDLFIDINTNIEKLREKAQQHFEENN